MSSVEVLPRPNSRSELLPFTTNPDELVDFLSRNFQRDPEHCRELAQEILAVTVAPPAPENVPILVPQQRRPEQS